MVLTANKFYPPLVFSSLSNLQCCYFNGILGILSIFMTVDYFRREIKNDVCCLLSLRRVGLSEQLPSILIINKTLIIVLMDMYYL